MKREKELAERRKNEPKLDTNQDHLVRKIFSRFRKGGSTSSGNLLSGVTIPSSGGTNVSNGPCGSQSGTPSHSSRDVERGDLFQQLSGEDSIGCGAGNSPRREKISLVKALKEDETGSVAGSVPGSRTSSAKSKWGRMIRGGSGSSDAADVGNEPQPSLSSSLMASSAAAKMGGLSNTATSPASTSTSKSGGENASSVRAQSAGSGNKIHPKLSRVPERQESVDEPPPSLLDRSRLKISQAFSTSVSADYSPSAGAANQLTRSDSSSIIDSFTELKQEVRSEVQRINHKMSRLEDILGEILIRLTPASVAAATTGTAVQPSQPVTVRPPPLPSPRTPGGRVRNAQVAPAPVESSSSSSLSSGANPFLIVPVDGSGTTPVAIDVDSGSAVESANVDGRNAPRTGGARRNRPRSGGNGDKLTTQFQEYV